MCAEFITLCRHLDLFAEACVAIDGSKFKAVNSPDRNVTRGKMKRRMKEAATVQNLKRLAKLAAIPPPTAQFA